jgi:hypothetical protein
LDAIENDCNPDRQRAGATSRLDGASGYRWQAFAATEDLISINSVRGGAR